jgi:hypothetical protein
MQFTNLEFSIVQILLLQFLPGVEMFERVYETLRING